MPSTLPLSQLLRARTRSAHRAIESLDFLRSFLRGVVEMRAYCRYLRDLLHVYEKLESSLAANHAHPMVRPLLLPVLWRQTALLADLRFLAPELQLSERPSPAALAYGVRLSWLGCQHPELLVAHAYARYLGDLSGGQILRRIAARALQLRDDQGLAFYGYPEGTDLQALKREYRARLDELPVNDVLAERIADEAVVAFQCNGDLLRERSGSAWMGVWKLLSRPNSALLHDPGVGQRRIPQP